MLKGLGKYLYFIAAVLFLASFSSRALSAIERTKKNEAQKELDLFTEALAYVQAQYVDETKSGELIYGAIDGMLARLDAHSQFLTPEEYEELKVDTEGKFGGVGIEITVKDNLITVITPIEGTPGWGAGFKPNDRIVKIDGVVIKNFTLSEVVKKLRGKPGTEVNITVWRSKEAKLYSFKIRRAIIDIKDIKEAKILEDHIGYLKLVEFREDTPQELSGTLKDLKEKGMDSLILDLRNNPGGLLDKAVIVAGMFLPKGSEVISVKGRDEKQNSDYKADYNAPYVNLPLVLLVNEGSASGSEIVAGAFQDHHRAVIVGVTTFGKGSVQTVIPLRDGSALKLTTSRYFTPSGKSIHEKGITPDIVVETKDIPEVEAPVQAQKEDIDSVFEQMEANNPEENPLQGTAVKEGYASDPPVARAVELLKSIKIYQSYLNR